MVSNLDGVHRDQLASSRCFVLREYMVGLSGLTLARKADALVELANTRGWTDSVSMTGAKLRILAEGDVEVPRWVVRSALELLLDTEWTPFRPHVWALFMDHWLYEHGPFFSRQDALDALPKRFDRIEASRWVDFFYMKIGDSAQTQFVCYFENQKGEMFGQPHISLGFLREAAIDAGIKWDGIGDAGLLVVTLYEYRETLLRRFPDLPAAERELIQKNGNKRI